MQVRVCTLNWLVILSRCWPMSCSLQEVKTNSSSKVRSSYGQFPYFSDILISGKNVVFCVQKRQHFCQKWKYWKNMQVDPNLNGLYSEWKISQHLQRCFYLLVMSLSGNFPSQSEPREKVPSWAKHRHFNFRAKTELEMYDK